MTPRVPLEAGCASVLESGRMNDTPPDFTLSVIVPVYNEERTLARLVDAVRAVPIRKQIVLVDDCSKDGSRAVMETFTDDERNTFVKPHHDVNRGKGAALRTGFARPRGQVRPERGPPRPSRPPPVPKTALNPVPRCGSLFPVRKEAPADAGYAAGVALASGCQGGELQ